MCWIEESAEESCQCVFSPFYPFTYCTSSKIFEGKVAIFENGKIYNADLNASYNIAARYWIREFLDPKSRARNGIVVGSVDINSIVLPARHQQTLASLTSLVRLMAMPSDTGRALYSSQVFSFKGKPPLYCVSN